EPDRLEAERERLRGEYGGVGLRLTEEEGWIKVLAPQEGTPAFRAGIRAGDVITHLDGASLHEIGLSEAIRRMRGPSGSKVAMTIRRDGVGEPFEVTLTRERSEEHTSELQSRENLVCRLLLENKNKLLIKLKDSYAKI